MNADEYTAPNAVRFVGIIVAHIRLLETLRSAEPHFGQTPEFFNRTSCPTSS